MPNQEEIPKYKVIAKDFRVKYEDGTNHFFGPVVASSEAYFMVIKSTVGEALVAGMLGPLDWFNNFYHNPRKR